MSGAQDRLDTPASVRQLVQAAEVARLRRFNAGRRAVILRALAARALLARILPTLAREYIETFVGSAIGFTVLAALLAFGVGVRGLYTFLAFGLVYAAQASYYKYKLSSDPTFVVPGCRCAGKRLEGAESVLRSSHSSLLGIPTSVLAFALYGVIAILAAAGDVSLALPLATLSVAVSAYLGTVMIVKIRSLCSICINLAALNVLILWQLLP